jgi:hypothetical protein
VTIAWGLPYFRKHVPKSPDGRRFPNYLPDRPARVEGARESAWPLCSMRAFRER